MAELIVRLPGAAERRVPLSRRPITLGRSETCDVNLRSDEVSRVHAEVWLDETGRVLVADKRSKNGTRVDSGEPFKSAVRVATRSVRVGEFEFEIVGGVPVGDAAEEVRFQPDAGVESGQTNFFPSSRGLDLNQQRLGLLMSLAERIGGAFERKQLLEQALDACCEALDFERGLIALKARRGEPELPTTRNVKRDETGAYTVSRTLINRALLHGERAVVNNPAIDLVGNITESLVRYPICSALCVPILHRDEILGVVYGDRITQSAAYTAEDVDFLAAIARQVGVGLANLRLFKEHIEAEKMYLEIERARTIQRELLPATPLDVGRMVLAGYNEPSSAVGGDYFDYFELGEGRVGLIIADVTGHGLPAALMMATLKGAVRLALTADVPLLELVARLNRQVCLDTTSGVFVTAILGRLDLASGVIEYVNAGHPGPLLLRGPTVSSHEDGRALPLGVELEERFHVQQIDPGDDLDGVLFYTDGLIEAESPDGRMLDVAPVMDILATLPERTADAVLRATLSVVKKHLASTKNRDDLTLMAIQYTPSAPAH